MAETTGAENKFAFQCQNCGAVEPAGAAGDNAKPGACHVCRHGVKYEVHPDGTGFNVIQQPENWIVLADLEPGELAKDFHRHGLKPENVAKHTPKNPGSATPATGKTVITTADEKVGSKDKAAANK